MKVKRIQCSWALGALVVGGGSVACSSTGPDPSPAPVPEIPKVAGDLAPKYDCDFDSAGACFEYCEIHQQGSNCMCGCYVLFCDSLPGSCLAS
jgi:hypothetical protein